MVEVLKKNVKKHALLAITVLFSGFGSNAYGSTLLYQDRIDLRKDTVVAKQMLRGANGLIIIPREDIKYFPAEYTFRDTLIINPAYLPIVFSGEVLPKNLDFTRKKEPDKTEFHLISLDETFTSNLKMAEELRQLRQMYSAANPDKLKYKMGDLQAQQEVKKREEKAIASRNVFQDLITAEAPPTLSRPEVDKVVPKMIYWIRHGSHQLQVSQNHISDNWYKGGNSNFAVKNEHILTLNYAKGKVKFDNQLEWKLNFQKTPADTLHNITINEDLVRLKNVFGYKAFSKWYYSASLLTETQIFNSYHINKDDRRTSFLSPLKMELGVGFTYNLEKSFKSDKFRKVKYSIDLAPLSGKLVYVGDEKVKETNFGVPEGKTTKIDYGSKVESSLLFNFNRYTVWTSRFKYFTNYDYIECEFENKLDLALNRFLSTSLYLNLRFDDRQLKDPSFGHLQMYEMVSFGLNYKW